MMLQLCSIVVVIMANYNHHLNKTILCSRHHIATKVLNYHSLAQKNISQYFNTSILYRKDSSRACISDKSAYIFPVQSKYKLVTTNTRYRAKIQYLY